MMDLKRPASAGHLKIAWYGETICPDKHSLARDKDGSPHITTQTVMMMMK